MMLEIIQVQGFYPLKSKITQFTNGFGLDSSISVCKESCV